MIIIDTNTLLLLVLGSVNVNLIESSERLSIFDKNDFISLRRFLSQKDEKIYTLPNIWTEVNNLTLKKIKGKNLYEYWVVVEKLMNFSIEVYEETSETLQPYERFIKLGVTDQAILNLAMKNKNALLISMDSLLSDMARSLSINVFDMKQIKNEQLK